MSELDSCRRWDEDDVNDDAGSDGGKDRWWWWYKIIFLQYAQKIRVQKCYDYISQIYNYKVSYSPSCCLQRF